MTDEDTEVIRVVKPKKISLLERYDIPVEHLSYEYISECTNGKMLERILLILRSGEEGIYPDLIKHTEERLTLVKPTSMVLRKAEPIRTRNMLEPNERYEIDNDINNWTTEMRSREKDLEEGKALSLDEALPQPDIRQIKDKHLKKNTMSTEVKNIHKTQRIPSCDYAAWDKYDADTEINKIDIEEERRQVENKRYQQKQKEINEKQRTAKDVVINKSLLTGTELNFMSEQEREKGNEAFRAGDYEEALEHYNSSIRMDSSMLTYNNRAMTYIKLHRYEDAINDCNVVLSVQYTNIKALLRRALSLENLEKSSQALADYEAALKLEPANKTAIAGVKKLRKPCDSKKVRMVIEETTESTNEVPTRNETEKDVKCNFQSSESTNDIGNICFCDRAPGPSRNITPRPHLRADYCLESEYGKKLLNQTEITKITEVPLDETNVQISDSVVKPRKNLSLNEKKCSVKTLNPTCSKGNNGLINTKAKSIFSYSTPPELSNSSVTIEEISHKSSKNSKENIKNEALDCSKEIKEISTLKLKKKCKSRNKGNINGINVKNVNNNEEQNTRRDEKCEMKPPFNSGKVQIANKYKNKTSKSQIDIPEKFSNINSPYEFVRVWQSLKNDSDLKIHAELLRSLNTDNLNSGNKLDGTMFSTIVRCLEQHFCSPKDKNLLNSFLKSLSQINRFSIMTMFMDSSDKKALRNVFEFLEEQRMPETSLLRQTYSI